MPPAMFRPSAKPLSGRYLSLRSGRGDCTSSSARLLHAGGCTPARLIYVLVTHRSIFTSSVESGAAEWSLLTGILVMLSGTLVIAAESELVTARLAETASQLGFSPVFIGVVVLALAGTIADLFASVGVRARRPHRDRRQYVRGLGAADRAGGRASAGAGVMGNRSSDEPGVRQPLDLFSIASASFIVRAIAADGETTWYESFLLVGVYVLFALAFFFQGEG